MVDEKKHLKNKFLEDLIRKQDPDYIIALELGQSAESPPLDLNNILNNSAPRQQYKTGSGLAEGFKIDPRRANFRQGYFDGLSQFLDLHEIGIRGITLKDLLSTNESLNYFADGLKLLPYIQNIHTPMMQEYLDGNQINQNLNKSVVNPINLEAYRLGFKVGMVKNYGITIPLDHAIPANLQTYIAFMQGFNGESITAAEDFNEDKIYNKMGLLAWLDRMVDIENLIVNEADNFVDLSEKIGMLLEPNYIGYFKAGLEGHEIPRYEPKSDTSKTSKVLNKFKAEQGIKGASPMVEFKLATCVYQTGKKFREYRKTA